jgi:asparagine synthetase B (glutamine-hydrolysing)
MSGGGDSAIMAVELKRAGIRFTPFSVTYPELAGAFPDESPLVKLTAKRLGLGVNWIKVRGEGLLASVPDLIALHEYPVSYGMLVAGRMIKNIHSRGHHDIVSAMGGDGIFAGGAEWWLGALTHSHPVKGFAQWLLWRRSIPLKGYLSSLLTFCLPTARRMLNSRRFTTPSWARIKPIFPAWYESTASDYYTYRREHEHQRVLHDLFNDSYLQTRSMGVRHILPFVDSSLLGFTQRIPPSLVLYRGWNKYLARYAYSDELPTQVIWNPIKMGFEVPVQRWVNGPWREEIIRILSSSNLLAEMFDTAALLGQLHTLPAWLVFRLYSTVLFLEAFQ